MILLDTDHVSALRMPANDRRHRLVTRLALVTDEAVAVPVVVIEETMRGWLSALTKERQTHRQVYAYRELASLFRFFAQLPIVACDDAAVTSFEGFGRVRIAAIAPSNNALLLTANRRDYERIPGLRFENWMDEPPASPNTTA